MCNATEVVPLPSISLAISWVGRRDTLESLQKENTTLALTGEFLLKL